MEKRKTPHPDSAITVHGRQIPVLRASELRQRRQSDQTVARVLNPWGRKDNDYTAPELKTNPGIPPERMAAFKLPSRVGKRLYYPDGSTSLIPGADNE